MGKIKNSEVIEWKPLTDHAALDQLTLCREGFFQNDDQQGCTACHDFCSFCFNSATECYACVSGSIYNALTNSCADTVCSFGLAWDTVTLACISCSLGCAGCDFYDSTDCTYCEPGYVYQYNTITNLGECNLEAISLCPGTTAIDESVTGLGNKICVYQCVDFCETCTQDGCTECVPGYKF